MPYVSPKELINTYLTQLRAWPTEPLSTTVFRKGPQRTANLAVAEPALGIVALKGLPDGEEPAASGNEWWQFWDLAILFLVPDDPEDPEAAEDTRLDLIEQFGVFQHQISVRTILPGAKVGRITSVGLGVGPYFEKSEQVFRFAEIVVSYRTKRS